MTLAFAQVATFVAKWKRLKLTDEDLQALESQIMENPDAGDVMQGTGGIRKVRFSPPSWHAGKRGAARVCYITIVDAGFCYLLTLFAKSEKGNLTRQERNDLRRLADILKNAHRAE